MYGAILGDIIGSPFEFREIRQKSKDFELFSDKSKFTDDTVMTIAVADAILRTGDSKDGRILFKNVAKAMLHYGKKYPHAGYGGGFRRWLKSDNPKPYNSFGNGSAMRVSVAGWIFNSMFDTRECARMTARPTHNHPEGVKGAMAVASAIFLARKGESKEEIKNYIEYEFDYDLSRTLDEIRPNYEFDETCQGSVPEAIIAFLESENFEDAIRNAVSLGGDTDTQAAIAGSIAEAFYGVPENLIKKCREYLPQEFLDVVDKFNFVKGYLADDLENDSLEEKIAEFNKIPSEKNSQCIKQEIFEMLQKNNPMKNHLKGFFAILDEKNVDGDEIWQADIIEKDGKIYDVLFTDTSEVIKHKHISENSQLVISDITEIFRIFEEVCLNDNFYGGLAINPYGENPFILERNDMQEILDAFHYDLWKKIQKSPYYPSEFTRKFLSNDLLTKEFFADARFIRISDSTTDKPGVLEVWNKNFEHYRCNLTDDFDAEKFHAAFMKEEDMPNFKEPLKNGWRCYYMDYFMTGDEGTYNFYVKEELRRDYEKIFGDEDIYPVEKFMFKILSEFNMKLETVNMESDISKFELPKDIVTYCRADISLLDYFEKILKSGGIVFDAGFTTTTMLKIGSTESELEIYIIVPKGVGHGAYIAPMSVAPEECEFVLNRGTFFKVRKVDRENSQVVIEVMGRSPKELD